jgi:hypothetical protein
LIKALIKFRSLRKNLLELFFGLLLIKTVGAEEAKIYLLGHPGSGNHWAAYCLSNLLNLPCVSHPYSDPYLWMSPGWEINENNLLKCDSFFHGHNPVDAYLFFANPKKDILILILRDFKESFMSNELDDEIKALKHLKKEITQSKRVRNPYQQRRNSLINSLRCFDQWPESRRLLICYEDLLLEPEKSITNIAHFFQIENSFRVKEFLRNYEQHQKNCFTASHFNQNRYYFDVKKHRKKMSNGVKRKMDFLLKTSWPHLWEKYLKEYQETDSISPKCFIVK